MPHFDQLDALVSYLRETGMIVWAGATPQEPGAFPVDRPAGVTTTLQLCRADISTPGSETPGGLDPRPSDVTVSEDLHRRLGEEILHDTSELRRRSSRPIRRGFVFVDISDFAKMASGVQLRVVASLVKLVEQEKRETMEDALQAGVEAKLCIGDG